MGDTQDQSTSLRQGDIVAGLFFPNNQLARIKFLTQMHQDMNPVQWAVGRAAASDSRSLILKHDLTDLQFDSGFRESNGRLMTEALFPVSSGYSIVLTQCCRLNMENAKQRTFFTACPVLKVTQGYLANPKWSEIKCNTPGSHANYFVLPLNLFEDGNGALVDFDMAFPVSFKDMDYARANRKERLSDELRVDFKRKLGAYFASPTDEERAAGLWPETPDDSIQIVNSNAYDTCNPGGQGRVDESHDKLDAPALPQE